jgi:hypothetical protein
MTFRFFFALFLLVTTFSFSQPAVKSVKVKSRYLVEQYDVLAANDTVRHGTYRRYFREDNVLLEEGQYADNKRTGVWTFYDIRDRPGLVYDYSTQQVITNNRPFLDSMGFVLLNDKMTGVQLTPPPIFLASQYQISGILLRQSTIPAQLLYDGVSELSYQLAATVSPVGVSYRVVASHKDTAFNKNTLKAISLAYKEVKWLPGYYQGEEVTAIYLLPTIKIRGFTVVRVN